MEAFPANLWMKLYFCTYTQPNTDVVAGAVDGTGFFVDDR